MLTVTAAASSLSWKQQLLLVFGDNRSREREAGSGGAGEEVMAQTAGLTRNEPAKGS